MRVHPAKVLTVDSRPLDLPVPSIVSGSTQIHGGDTQAHCEIKPQCHDSAGQSSPIQQPFRFLTNSVSISVNSNSAKQVGSPPQGKVGTPSQKDVHEVDKGPKMKAVSCACEIDIHRKFASLFDLSVQRRCFGEWRWQQRKNQWKRISRAKDEQIVYLLDKLEDSMFRIVAYCRTQNKRRLLKFWRSYIVYMRRKNAIEAKADAFFALKTKSKVWRRWRAMAIEARWCRQIEARARHRHQISLKWSCLQSWRDQRCLALDRMFQAVQMNSARTEGFLVQVIAVWKHFHKVGSMERRIQRRNQKEMICSFFEYWKWEVSYRKNLCRVEKKASAKNSVHILARMFRGWHATMERGIICRLLQQCIFSIHMIQNLFVDNTRLASIVDTGRWGEEQIELLHAAASMLREEKVCLQNVLNQFPWSKDRRLFSSSSSRGVKGSQTPSSPCYRTSLTKKGIGSQRRADAACPDVFLRLSGSLSSEKPSRSCHRSNEQTETHTLQSEGSAEVNAMKNIFIDDMSQHRATFERLAILSDVHQGIHQGNGVPLLMSVPTDGLTRVEDIYKVIKTVDASFSSMGFSFSSG